MRPAIAPSPSRTAALTVVTMAAFASNSILCRLALRSGEIDPAGFTALRVAAGAATLAVIARSRRTASWAGVRAGWRSAAWLFLYAIAFSFAYVSLSAGTGALILFGSVQATMIAVALRAGERPHRLEWIGLGVALAGLVCLTAPGLSAPSPAGSALMGLAGVSWGLYTLAGRGSASPVGDTARNFMRAAPLAVLAPVLARAAGGGVHASPRGLALAVLSGALASGVGYAVWYSALRGLTATRAATVQLSVPVIAALGGVVFLAEVISLRLVLSAILILGGVAIALFGRAAPSGTAAAGCGQHHRR